MAVWRAAYHDAYIETSPTLTIRRMSTINFYLMRDDKAWLRFTLAFLGMVATFAAADWNSLAEAFHESAVLVGLLVASMVGISVAIWGRTTTHPI